MRMYTRDPTIFWHMMGKWLKGGVPDLIVVFLLWPWVGLNKQFRQICQVIGTWTCSLPLLCTGDSLPKCTAFFQHLLLKKHTSLFLLYPHPGWRLYWNQARKKHRQNPYRLHWEDVEYIRGSLGKGPSLHAARGNLPRTKQTVLHKWSVQEWLQVSWKSQKDFPAPGIEPGSRGWEPRMLTPTPRRRYVMELLTVLIITYYIITSPIVQLATGKL